MKIRTIILALLLLPNLTYAIADAISAKDQEQLSQGSMVKKVDWKEGYVWPEVTILVLLNHAPLDNLNVFLDFESHKKYIPDMIESQILKIVSSNQTHVYFEMEMPWPVKKTSHVTNNIVTNNSDGSYTLQWNLVKAEMLKATDGSMTFIPYQGKTLLKYVSFIVPNSSFAGMFKDRVAKDVEKSVIKITKHLNATINNKKHLFSTSQKKSNQNNL